MDRPGIFRPNRPLCATGKADRRSVASLIGAVCHTAAPHELCFKIKLTKPMRVHFMSSYGLLI